MPAIGSGLTGIMGLSPDGRECHSVITSPIRNGGDVKDEVSLDFSIMCSRQIRKIDKLIGTIVEILYIGGVTAIRIASKVSIRGCKLWKQSYLLQLLSWDEARFLRAARPVEIRVSLRDAIVIEPEIERSPKCACSFSISSHVFLEIVNEIVFEVSMFFAISFSEVNWLRDKDKGKKTFRKGIRINNINRELYRWLVLQGTTQGKEGNTGRQFTRPVCRGDREDPPEVVSIGQGRRVSSGSENKGSFAGCIHSQHGWHIFKIMKRSWKKENNVYNNLVRKNKIL